jgi:hypothetical protein
MLTDVDVLRELDRMRADGVLVSDECHRLRRLFRLGPPGRVCTKCKSECPDGDDFCVRCGCDLRG